MKESEWLACTEPDRLLCLPQLRDKISARKRRLFACACCRRLWKHLTDPRSLAAVESAEKYADGLITQDELEAAKEESRHAVSSPVITFRTTFGGTVSYSPGTVAMSVALTEHLSPRSTALFATMFVEEMAGTRDAYHAERKEQAGLFRELIATPFRPITLNPAWQTLTVLALAHAAYDNRTLPAGTLETARLAVLADALEEAGCTEAELLGHLRGPAPHVRGCWALDLILAKG